MWQGTLNTRTLGSRWVLCKCSLETAFALYLESIPHDLLVVWWRRHWIFLDTSLIVGVSFRRIKKTEKGVGEKEGIEFSNMTQRRFRRYVSMSAVALMFVFACTVGYLAQSHVEVSRYEYQKELSRRLLATAAVLESLPVNYDLLSSVLTNLEESSSTANRVTFRRHAQAIGDANFSLLSPPHQYEASLYSQVFGGTFKVAEVLEGGVTFSSRTMSCSIGLCIMVIYLCVYISFALGANALVMYRRIYVVGVVITATGILASIGFIVGMAVVVGDAQRKVQMYERGRDMLSTVSLVGDIIQALKQADTRATSVPVLLGVFRALNAASPTSTWSVTANGVLGPSATTPPPAESFFAQPGGSFRVLEDTPSSLFLAASAFSKGIDATIGYTYQRSRTSVASTPYVRSAIVLGVVGIALLSVALIICIPLSGIGSAPVPFVQTEPGAKPLPTEEWEPSPFWEIARAGVSSLTLLLAFSVCTVFVISGTTMRITGLPDASDQKAQARASGTSLVLLDEIASAIGGLPQKMPPNSISMLQVPSTNISAIQKLYDDLKGPLFTTARQIYSSIDTLPLASLNSNVSACLAGSSTTARDEALKYISYADSYFLNSIVIQDKQLFIQTQTEFLAAATRSVPSCEKVFSYALINQTRKTWMTLSEKFGIIHRPQRFANAKALLLSSRAKLTRTYIEAARRATPDPPPRIPSLQTSRDLEAAKCEAVVGPAIAALVMLCLAGITEAAATLFVFSDKSTQVAWGSPGVQRDAFRLVLTSLIVTIGCVVFLSISYAQTVAQQEHHLPAGPDFSVSGKPLIDSLYYGIVSAVSQLPQDVRNTVNADSKSKRAYTALASRVGPVEYAALRKSFADISTLNINFLWFLTAMSLSVNTTDGDVKTILEKYTPHLYNQSRHDSCLTSTQQRRFAELSLTALTIALIPAKAPQVSIDSVLSEITAMADGLGPSCADVADDLRPLQLTQFIEYLNGLFVVRLSGPAATAFDVTKAYLSAAASAIQSLVPENPEDETYSAIFWVPVLGAWLLSPAIVVAYFTTKALFTALLGL